VDKLYVQWTFVTLMIVKTLSALDVPQHAGVVERRYMHVLIVYPRSIVIYVRVCASGQHVSVTSLDVTQESAIIEYAT
jgi:hypothetical protein